MVFCMMLCLVLFASVSYSEVIRISIPVNALDIEDIKSTKGVIVKKGKIDFIEKVDFSKNVNTVSVLINVSNAKENSASLVGAVLEDTNGKKIYSTLKPIAKYLYDEKDLPFCPHEKANITLLSGQESALKELIATRKKRQVILENEIKSLLSENMIYVLGNLEKYFGLVHDKPLSANLESEELLIRLSHIKIAIKNLDAHKLRRVRVEREAKRKNDKQ
ncbi:MAG: hypothetical protein ACOX3T_07350 [Bdellovibrionota bacterium]